MILSRASRKSLEMTFFLSDLIANIPASVHMALRSAQDSPSVSSQIVSKSMSSSIHGDGVDVSLGIILLNFYGFHRFLHR